MAAPQTSHMVAETNAANPSYLDWSRAGRSTGWRYLAGALLILLLWLIGSGILLAVGALAVGASINADGTLNTDPAWLSLLITLATFIPFLLGTLLIVRFLLQRPALTVITPYTRINWRLVGYGAGAWVAATAISSLPLLFAHDEGLQWSFEWATFVPVLVIALTVLFVQTTAEELFFRGYLLQWFGTRLRNAWVLASVSGVLFTAPHLANPEVAGLVGGELLVGALPYFAIGFALGLVSVRSGTIELAIGAHFINNFIGVVIISASNSVLGTTSVWVDTTPAIGESAIGALVATVIFVAVTWRVRGSGQVRTLQPAGSSTQPPTASAVLPGAGWFPDPLQRATYRYWDGSSWTGHEA